MDRFRESRRQSMHRKQPHQLSLHVISPQKKREDILGFHGSGQSPLPTNRLSEAILHKQALTTRKYEQTQQKLRQKQVAYRHLSDMYDKVVKQKQGIQSSLTQQIEMYRNLIKEIEEKAENRLKQVQKAFKEEMQRKLEQKQEQARLMQGEKQQLQQFVSDLQKIGDELEQKLNITSLDLKNTQQNLQRRQQQKAHLEQKLEEKQNFIQAQSEKYQNTIDGLKQNILQNQREWRHKLEQQNKAKETQMKQIEKDFKDQITKIVQKNEEEKQTVKQQIKQLQESFQNEKVRLNDIITNKDKSIEQCHKQSKQGIQKLNNTIRGYEQEIQSLASEKARLFEQVDSLNSENTHLNILIKEVQLNSANEKKSLEAYILKLKDEINFSQGNFLRERDRNIVTFQDSSKQILNLKRDISFLQTENEKLKEKSTDTLTLTEQIRKLREMLVQSSYELQKCKTEYVKISKQRDLLALRLNENHYQMGNLRRVKLEREQQARGWRDSYYLNRSRSIRR